jgi:predicted amino acid racemase
MVAPRLEIDLDKIEHNARNLVQRLARKRITVTGVTKAALGSPEIARSLLRAGVTALGDSRIENIEAMRRAGISVPMTLIRSPMPSQAARVVRHADVSLNTELDVIAALSIEASKARRVHEIIIMVELGDLREGVMPGDLKEFVRRTLAFPYISLKGLGANLACQNGVCPDETNMAELSTLANKIEQIFDLRLEVISGGNSSNLEWALGDGDTGRVNDLRLGESILLGCEPLGRRPITGLHTNAFTLVAEAIEAKVKPSLPWGKIAQPAFGDISPINDRGPMSRVIVAVGHHDTDPSGLRPPPGLEIIGASSDHLVLNSHDDRIAPGDEIAFQIDYGALIRSAMSPFVDKVHGSKITRESGKASFLASEFKPSAATEKEAAVAKFNQDFIDFPGYF